MSFSFIPDIFGISRFLNDIKSLRKVLNRIGLLRELFLLFIWNFIFEYMNTLSSEYNLWNSIKFYIYYRYFLYKNYIPRIAAKVISYYSTRSVVWPSRLNPSLHSSWPLTLISQPLDSCVLHVWIICEKFTILLTWTISNNAVTSRYLMIT